MFHKKDYVYCIGIGGAGVSAIARYAIQQSATVSGCDVSENTIIEGLRKSGVEVTIGHPAIPAGVTHVVFSPAVPEDDPARIEATARGIVQYSYPEALGEIFGSYSTRIAVSGTNGKSTTTAMLATILEQAGLNPTVVVGSLVPSWGNTNFRMGSRDLMIVEASEWQDHFHELSPTHVIVTNIEEEHMDYFEDMAHLTESFSTFLRPAGYVALNESIPRTAILGLETKVHDVFGSSATSDLYFQHPQIDDGTQLVMIGGKAIQSFDIRLHVPGRFNIENALGAIAVALQLGVGVEDIQKGLATFRGIWRRFEHRGVFKGAQVYSDYGHHPSAIRATINGAREFFPRRRIVVVFQPHLHSRTQKLFEQFVEAFQLADLMILTEIYDVAGRDGRDDGIPQVSSRDFASRLDPATSVVVGTREDAKTALELRAQPEDIIIVMGAGDIDQLAYDLANA